MLKSVDVNNDILTFPFNDKILGFGEIELIFSICYACRSEKTTEIQTNIKEICKAREYGSMSDLELRESLLITGKKLLSFNICLNDEDGTVIAPFTVFHFNGETLKVEKYYEKPKGRGRSRLGGYIFTFDRPQNMDKYKLPELDKGKEPKEEQGLDSETEMDMFPENIPFFD